MSDKRRRLDEFSVGLTVMAAIVILVGGIIWAKGLSFSSKHKVYEVLFPEVYGLKEGSSVLVQGVAHGKVGTITLAKNGAMVQVLLDDGVVLHSDARVMLFSPQLMSGRMVTIDPGTSSKKLPAGSTITGEVPAGVGEVMATSGQVLDQVLKMVKEFRVTAHHLDSMMVKTRMLERVDSSINDLNAMTSDMRSDVSHATIALREGAEQIRGTAVKFNSLVSDNSPRFDTLMVRLDRITMQAEGVSDNLEDFSNRLNNKGGTLGKLVYSDTLHNQLVRTLANIDSLAAKLKKDGVQVKLF